MNLYEFAVSKLKAGGFNIDIEKSFVSIYREERRFILNLLKGDSENADYQFGYMTGLFIDGDPRVNNLLVACGSSLTADMKDQVLTRYQGELERNRDRYVRKFREACSENRIDWISFFSAKHATKSLKRLSFENMEKELLAASELLKSSITRKGRLVSNDELIHFRITNMVYEDFCQLMEHPFDAPSINLLEEYYMEKEIDLNDDAQYIRYGLISVEDNYTIKPSAQPKLYDKRLNTHIFIEFVKSEIVYLINELKNSGMIAHVAFRPNCLYAADNVPDHSIVMEELERGSIFSIDGLGSADIAKLYSVDLDCLWILRTGEEITFEELRNDFDTHGDCVVTQVLHLQYEFIGGEYLIHHLDHEYIFYTLDEYLKRQTDPRQKGEAKKRFKTFKIDKSRIPFFLNDGSCILYMFLRHLFVKHDLLREYFARVINS